jgi:hypothetical protein
MNVEELECEIGLCRRRAKWIPKLIVPPHTLEIGRREAELIAGVVVCDVCRMGTSPKLMLSPQQRGQIDVAFDVAGKAQPNWDYVRFEWLDLSSQEVAPYLPPIVEKQSIEKERRN